MRSGGTTIARRCGKIWTTADERQMQRNVALLRAEITSAGGFERWVLDGGVDAWLAPPRACPVRLRAADVSRA